MSVQVGKRKFTVEQYQAHKKRNSAYLLTTTGKENHKVAMRKYNASNRLKLIEMLGGICNNPKCEVPNRMKDIRALQIDFIKGGGSKEHKKMSEYLYVYYLNRPEEAKQKLQVLCANCNWIKRSEKGEMKKTAPIYSIF